MKLAEYRKSRGLSQSAFAREVGLASKSYISEIETGAQPASVRLALIIQKLSGGAVPAEELVRPEDKHLLAEAAAEDRGAP